MNTEAPPEKLMVSWTRMSAWNNCNYAFFLRYIKNISPTKVSERMSKGRIIHDLLDHHYQFQIDKEYPSVDDCIKENRKYTQEVLSTLDPMETTLLFHCSYVAEQYIAYWQPEYESIYKTVATELQIENEMVTPNGNEFILLAIVDRLLLNMETKRLVLGELKSHSARPWSTAAIEMDGQQPLYLKLLQEAGYDVTAVLYLFANVYEYKDRDKKKYTDYFDKDLVLDKPAVVDGFFEELYAFVDEIYDSVGKRPRRRISRNCERCDLQSYCYARLKGFSHQAGLSLGYKIKEDNLDDVNRRENGNSSGEITSTISE